MHPQARSWSHDSQRESCFKCETRCCSGTWKTQVDLRKWGKIPPSGSIGNYNVTGMQRFLY
eukprot:1475046-Rhodomonas_salina.1